MSMICPKCNNAVYLGSRLPEDAYYLDGVDEQGGNIYIHFKCPPELHTKYCRRCDEAFYTEKVDQIYCGWFCEKEHLTNPNNLHWSDTYWDDAERR